MAALALEAPGSVLAPSSLGSVQVVDMAGSETDSSDGAASLPPPPPPKAASPVQAALLVPSPAAEAVKSDKKPRPVSAADEELNTALSSACIALASLPDTLARRDDERLAVFREELATRLAVFTHQIEAGTTDWRVNQPPDWMATFIGEHIRTGHDERGTTPDGLAGNHYRRYLFSLTEQELAVEQCMNSAGCLQKLRQLEHSAYFHEERSRKAAALPSENLREWQQTCTAWQNAADVANLAEQVTVEGTWATARTDQLAIGCRGGCLSGLYSLAWALTHWSPRRR